MQLMYMSLFSSMKIELASMGRVAKLMPKDVLVMCFFIWSVLVSIMASSMVLEVGIHCALN